MYRIIFPLLLLLTSFATVRAQQMPERSQVRKGNRHYGRGEYREAIERYGTALALAPGSYEAAYNLGNALYKAEMYDKAAETMTRAAADSLRTPAERAEAFYNLGNAFFQQKKYREALESYKQSLLLEPSDREAKYNYAYTKRLIDDQQQNGGGGQNRDQNQQDRQDQQDRGGGQDGRQDQQDGEQTPQQGENRPEDGRQENPEDGRGASEEEGPEGGGSPQPAASGLSEQEQQQMLDAIQAQEDRTQEKLKEKQGVVVRGRKNW